MYKQKQTTTDYNTASKLQKKSMVSSLILSLATFNVLGLKSPEKRYQLAADCYNYSIDILAIQETKCVKSENTIIQYIDDNDVKHNYRLILFEQKDCWQAGVGFMISSKLESCFKSYGQISDRVAYCMLILCFRLNLVTIGHVVL